MKLSAVPVIKLITSIPMPGPTEPLANEKTAKTKATGPAPTTGINEQIKVIKKIKNHSLNWKIAAPKVTIKAWINPVKTLDTKTSRTQDCKVLINCSAFFGLK